MIEFGILGMVDFGQFLRRSIEHAFADQLLLCLAVVSFESLVEPKVSTFRVLEEDRRRNSV